MKDLSKPNFFNFLILLSLFQGISCEFGSAKEQRKIEPRIEQQNSFSNESQDDTIITTAITLDEKKFDDNELRKLFVQKFRLYAEKTENTESKADILSETKFKRESPPLKRVARTDSETDDKVETITEMMECYQCYSNRAVDYNSNCFNGVHLPKETCATKSQCYSEIHHNYVRRGCASASRNRTFVCKCPLCNDKDADDMTHFEYVTIEDWKYDNSRLRKLTMGIELMCKVCSTKGINKSVDKICRFGRHADYMVCGPSQLCYTNIEEETNYVSRGCISMPVYNPMYLYCNYQLCNNQKFEGEILTGKLENFKDGLLTRRFIGRRLSSSSWVHKSLILNVIPINLVILASIEKLS